MYLFIQQTQFRLEVVWKIVLQGDMPDSTLHLTLVGLLRSTMFFPFLDIPFNQSMGVE